MISAGDLLIPGLCFKSNETEVPWSQPSVEFRVYLVILIRTRIENHGIRGLDWREEAPVNNVILLHQNIKKYIRIFKNRFSGHPLKYTSSDIFGWEFKKEEEMPNFKKLPM